MTEYTDPLLVTLDSTQLPLPVSGSFSIPTPLPVSDNGGSLTVDGSVTVTGTVTANTGLTQPLTDTQLRANPVPVSGTVTANTGLSQPLTDTQLRANPVPISGTVTANTGLTQPLTDTQLRNSAVPISASALPLPTNAATSALQTQPGVDIGDVTINNANGAAAVNIQDGGNSITVDGSLTSVATISNVVHVDDNSGSLTIDQATGTNLHTVVDSGTITTVSSVTSIANALPAGSNVIGHIISDSGSTTAVTGNVTAIQGTGTNLHAVIDSGSTTAVTQATGTNLHAVIDSGSTTAVTQATGTNLHAVVDSGTVTTVSTVTNLSQQGGVNISLNTGVRDTGTQRVTIATNDLVPISAAALPLPTGASTETTLAAISAKTPSLGVTSMAASSPVVIASDQFLNTRQYPAYLAVTATATAGSAVTATLASIVGQYHYISAIDIQAYNSAARTGGATPVLVTSTNLPGSNVWTFASAGAIGTTELKTFNFPQPLRSSAANTNTTIVCPATTSVIWRVNVYYSAF